MPQLSFDELRDLGLADEVANTLRLFTVGFVRVVERNGREDFLHCGSGTLVNVNGRLGILTADHVLNNLPNTGVGLAFPVAAEPRVHRILIQTSEHQKWHIGPATNTAAGPDLGFLELHPADRQRLPTSCAFYDLAARREKVLPQPRDPAMGGWYLCGSPDEWTTEARPERTFTRVRLFGAFCGAIVVARERLTDQFDYLDAEVNVAGQYEGPMDFGGVSGGGLWQIVFVETDGKIGVGERLLSGVAYYQLAEDGAPHTIVCHGRRSIYGVLLAKLTEPPPNPSFNRTGPTASRLSQR